MKEIPDIPLKLPAVAMQIHSRKIVACEIPVGNVRIERGVRIDMGESFNYSKLISTIMLQLDD